MGSLPLHPALVHLPLGLSFVLPLAAGAVAWSAWRGELPRRGALVLLALYLLLVGGATAALKTGESEEERVEGRVVESALAAHERAAQQFLAAAVGGLGLTLLGVMLRGRGARVLSSAGVAAGLAVAVLALRVGHAGGELVYLHGAAGGPATAEAGSSSAAAIASGGEHAGGEQNEVGRGERRHRERGD